MVSFRRNKPMAVAATDVHRWTREEYERMADQGLFAPDARVELIDGIIYDMSPQKGPHTTCLHLALRLFNPLALGDDSEPEPDLAVVQGAENWPGSAKVPTAVQRSPSSRKMP